MNLKKKLVCWHFPPPPSEVVSHWKLLTTAAVADNFQTRWFHLVAVIKSSPKLILCKFPEGLEIFDNEYLVSHTDANKSQGALISGGAFELTALIFLPVRCKIWPLLKETPIKSHLVERVCELMNVWFIWLHWCHSYCKIYCRFFSRRHRPIFYELWYSSHSFLSFLIILQFARRRFGKRLGFFLTGSQILRNTDPGFTSASIRTSAWTTWRRTSAAPRSTRTWWPEWVHNHSSSPAVNLQQLTLCFWPAESGRRGCIRRVRAELLK